MVVVTYILQYVLFPLAIGILVYEVTKRKRVFFAGITVAILGFFTLFAFKQLDLFYLPLIAIGVFLLYYLFRKK